MRTGLLGWLARTPVLIGFFIAALLIGASFYFVLEAIDGDLLDMIWSGEGAISRLIEMTDRQREVHLLGTVTLDVLYPIAYGGLLVGLLCRLAWNWRWALILVPIATVLCDFSENTVQAMALNGHTQDILLVKDIVTPIKFAGLGLSLALVIILALGTLVRYLLARSNSGKENK